MSMTNVLICYCCKTEVSDFSEGHGLRTMLTDWLTVWFCWLWHCFLLAVQPMFVKCSPFDSCWSIEFWLFRFAEVLIISVVLWIYVIGLVIDLIFNLTAGYSYCFQWDLNTAQSDRLIDWYIEWLIDGLIDWGISEIGEMKTFYFMF